MGDDITIGVTEIVNNIEVTAQPNDQVIDINVTDNSDDVTLNVTPNVIEVNINKGSSFARWGSIFGNLTDQADLTNALFNKADLVDGKVPSYQLPSFVDDVIEVADFAALPTVGEIGKIYITLDNNKIYRWSGSIYIEIASNQAIWGAITGTLTNQTDLVNALNLKADKTITITPNAPLTGGGDLSANRSISINQSGASSDGFLSSTDWNTFNNKQNQLNGTGFVKVTGTTVSYDNSTYVPTSRTININGNEFDLSANRAWSIPTHNAVSIGSANGLSITSDGQVLSLALASAGSIGALSANDWMTFNSKIGGSGTSNYLPKFTGASSLGNSQIVDNGTNVGIGTVTPPTKLTVFTAAGGNLSGLVVASTNATLNIWGGSSSDVNIDITNGVVNGSTATNLNIRGGGTSRLYINSTGNVGIGTTSPTTFSGYTTLTIDNTAGSFTEYRQGGTNTFRVGSNESNGGFLFTQGSTPLRFGTIDTERMRITSSGNVGIGTTTVSSVTNQRVLEINAPLYSTILSSSGTVKLSFTANSESSWGAIGTDSNHPVIFTSNSTERMRITSGGLVLMPFVFSNTSGGAANVGIAADGNLYRSTSSLKYKKNVENYTKGLNEIMQIRPVTYNSINENEDGVLYAGLIAEEIHELGLTEFVQYAEDGTPDALSYANMVSLLVKGIQELKAEIEILKQK